MRLLIAVIFCTFSVCVSAEVIKMAVITSEFDKNVTDYYLETNDQNQIHSMRYITTMPNGGIFEDVSVSVETVMSEGAVIVERNGYEAVRLEVENFSRDAGGIIKLNYLYSGVTGVRHVKRLQLKSFENKFKLTDMQNAPVNRLFLRVNLSRIFGIIGVKDILSSYSEE